MNIKGYELDYKGMGFRRKHQDVQLPTIVMLSMGHCDELRDC